MESPPMSLALLYETQTELRRLSIAGGVLAKDDLRLKKLVPQLAEAGKTAPVFARLSALLSQASSGIIAAFLEAATLVNAILTTQASSGQAGEIIPQAGDKITGVSSLSYNTLKPLLSALTTKGSGRFEMIERSIRNGTIYDVRLLPALFAALNDSFAAIPPLLVPVLKHIGRPLLSRLQQDFSPEIKGAGNVCRLEILAHFLGKEGLDLYRDAYEKGTIPVKVKAIEIMADYPDCESLLVQACQHKKWEIFAAAFYAMGKIPGPNSAAILEENLSSAKYRMAIESISQGGVPEHVGILVRQAQALVAPVREQLATTKGKLGSDTPVDRFFCLLAAIANTPMRTDEVWQLLVAAWQMSRHNQDISLLSETLPFSRLPSFVDNDGTLERTLNFCNVRDNDRLCQVIAAKALVSFGTREALDILEADLLSPTTNKAVIYFTAKLALKLRDPASFYETYQPLMESGVKNAQYSGITELFSRMADFISRYSSATGQCDNAGIVLDSRWTVAFLKWRNLPMVAAFIAEGDDESEQYLRQKLEDTLIPANHHSSTFFVVYQAMLGLHRLNRTADFLPRFLAWLEVDYLGHLLLVSRPVHHSDLIPYSQEVAQILSLFPDQARPLLARLREALGQKKSRDLYLVDLLIEAFENAVSGKADFIRKASHPTFS